MKILGIGNAIIDVICKVEETFITKNNLTKGTMKLIFLEKISELDETNPALSQLISSIEVNLSNQLNNDVFTYFLNSLRDNIKININNNAIENTLSRFE